ncbi:hypothetical protein [Kitasatospora sp. HPMI-4]
MSLPDTPYAMWARGELDDHLRLPEPFGVETGTGSWRPWSD